MTDNNHNQDDFDPSLEEGLEDSVYEEQAFDEEGFGDDSWDEDFSEGAMDAVEEDADEGKQPHATKKKGGLFNIILITAAVLGGGAFIYLKVLAPSGGTVPQPTPIAEAPSDLPVESQQASLQPGEPVAPSPVEPALVNAPVPEQAAPSDGLLPTLAPPSEPPVLAEAPAATAVDPVPALISPPISETLPVVVTTPAEVPGVPEAPAPIAAPEAIPETAMKSNNDFSPGLPSAKDILLPPVTDNQASPPVMNQVAAPADAIPADVAKGIEQKLSVLLARLDTFEGRITNLEGGVHQVSSKIAALESKPAATSDVDGLNKTIQVLERKISSLENVAAVAPAPVVTPDVAKIDKPTFVPAAPEPVTASPKAPIVETPKRATKTEPAAASARSVDWVLRSAQLGAAMVVPKAGGDMRTIRVGDSLSGLGRITAIEQRGSRWVVQGTLGTLTH